MRLILPVLISTIMLTSIDKSFSTEAKYKASVGFGSTNSFLSDLAVESFVTGFSFALKDETQLKNDVYIETLMDRSPLASAVLARRLLDNGAKALVGFPGSHDCLLAAREASKVKASALLLNCSHNDLKQYAGKMATTVNDMDQEVQSMLEFLAKHESGKRGVVIIHPQHISSRLQGEIYKKLAKEFKNSISLQVIELTELGTIQDSLLKSIMTTHGDFIVLTAYPDLLLPLREQITKEGISSHLYGSSAWDNLEVARRFLLNLKNRFVYPTSWNRETDRSKKFIKSFKNNFAKEPTPEAAFGYDLGLILVQIGKSNNLNPLNVGLQLAIAKKKCFNELLTGKICLGDSGAHSFRKRVFVQVTQKGLMRVLPK